MGDLTNNNNNNNKDFWDQYVLGVLPSAREFFEQDSNNNIKNEFKTDTSSKIIFEPFSFDDSGKNNIDTNNNNVTINDTVNNSIFISLINIENNQKIDYIKFEPYKLYSEDFFNLKKNHINEVKFLNNDNIGEKSDFFLNIGGGQKDSEEEENYMIKTRTKRLKERKTDSNNINDTAILIFGLVNNNDNPINGTIMYTKTNIENLDIVEKLGEGIQTIDYINNDGDNNDNNDAINNTHVTKTNKNPLYFRNIFHLKKDKDTNVNKPTESKWRISNFFNEAVSIANYTSDLSVLKGGKRNKTKKINTKNYKKSKKNCH